MKTIWVIVIAVFITGIITGGGVYAYQNNKAKTDQDTLKSQISTLQSQNSTLQKQIADTTSTNTTGSTTSAASAPSDPTAGWKTYRVMGTLHF